MIRFHIALHPRPASASKGPTAELLGKTVSTLSVPEKSRDESFGVTFDQCRDQLSSLPRMFIEPDGAFVWVDSAGASVWQLDGNLVDRGTRLQYVELKGSCSAAAFDQLCNSLGPLPGGLMTQFLQEAIYLAEDDFKLWAFGAVHDSEGGPI